MTDPQEIARYIRSLQKSGFDPATITSLTGIPESEFPEVEKAPPVPSSTPKAHPHSRFTDDDIDAAISLREEGVPVKEIADMMDISPTHLSNLMMERRPDLRHGRGRARNKGINKKVIELANQGYSAREISEEVGRDTSVVYKYLREAGVTIQSSRKPRQYATEDDREKMAELRLQGMTYDAIARKLGFSKTCVENHLRNGGSECVRITPDNIVFTIDKDSLADFLSILSGMSNSYTYKDKGKMAFVFVRRNDG